MLANCDLDLHPRRHVLPQNLSNSSDRTAATTWARGYFGDNHLAMTSTVNVFRGNDNVLSNSRVIRHHHGYPLFYKKSSHDLLRTGFYNAHNSCFGAAFIIGTCFFSENDIAV